jgi:hypothetical protein
VEQLMETAWLKPDECDNRQTAFKQNNTKIVYLFISDTKLIYCQRNGHWICSNSESLRSIWWELIKLRWFVKTPGRLQRLKNVITHTLQSASFLHNFILVSILRTR